MSESKSIVVHWYMELVTITLRGPCMLSTNPIVTHIANKCLRGAFNGLNSTKVNQVPAAPETVDLPRRQNGTAVQMAC